MQTINKKTFFAAAIGTLIEYYDYGLFSMLLPLLAPLFFPAESAYASLSKSYYFLLIPMIVRPFGALIFGHIGDVFGRPKALMMSIYGIAIASLIIGVTPTCSMIGATATVIIIIAKSVQVFCYAGEYNGAGIYVVEQTHTSHQAFMGSALTAMTLLGSLLASIAGILITATFAPDYGWRIAFIIGGIVGILGIAFRKNLYETPNFIPATKNHGLKVMLKAYWRELIAGIFIGGFITVPFTSILIFINPILATHGYFTNQQLMIVQTMMVLLAICVLLVAGKLADRYTPDRVMKYGAFTFAMFAYPICLLLDTGNMVAIMIALSLLMIANQMIFAPSNAYLKNLFIMQYRYRAASLSFCLGFSMLGGLTPIVQNYLYSWFGSFAGISFWFIFVALGTALSMLLVEHQQFKISVHDPISADS